MTRNEDIPLRLVMPRYFTCPNIKSDIYDLDFQIRYEVHVYSPRSKVYILLI